MSKIQFRENIKLGINIAFRPIKGDLYRRHLGRIITEKERDDIITLIQKFELDVKEVLEPAPKPKPEPELEDIPDEPVEEKEKKKGGK